MKCKFCFAEIEEDVTVCPVCGKALEETEETPVEETAEEAEETSVEEIAEETEEAPVAEEVPAKKKSKTLLVVLAALGGLVLAAALVIAVLYGMGYKLSSIGAFLGLQEASLKQNFERVFLRKNICKNQKARIQIKFHLVCYA